MRGSNFSGRSIVFAIPELITLVPKNKFVQSTLEDQNTEKTIQKSIILPMTISLECGLVGQSRILYRTCEKKNVQHNVITYFKECYQVTSFP